MVLSGGKKKAGKTQEGQAVQTEGPAEVLLVGFHVVCTLVVKGAMKPPT